MLSNRLYKFATKVVLTSYLTQLLAPIVYACEFDTRTERSWKNSLRDQSPPQERVLQSSLHQSLNIEPINSPANPSDLILDENKVKSQANYQYRLKVKTKGVLAEDIKIKLSRRTKGTEESFTTLHTSIIHQETLSPSTSQKTPPDDVLENPFKRASIYKTNHLKDTAGFGWMIPELATN